MQKFGLLAAGAALALAGGLSAPAHAIVCTSTINVDNGGTVGAATLLGGACVAAGDKIFGEFSTGGAITNTGAASFSFFNPPGNVTIGFLGTVGPNSVGILNYTVAIDPVFAAQGWRITDLQKDFTLNAAGPGSAAATLTGSTNPATQAFSCTRTVPPAATDNCPVIGEFGPVLQLTVNETITTGANAIVTALTDTISQTQVTVPEPASLSLRKTPTTFPTASIDTSSNPHSLIHRTSCAWHARCASVR